MNINEKTTIQFDDNFFKEEIRCGFKVTEKQKKTWAIELDLVNKLIEVCAKYDIKIFVFAGTLLGAIRHKGFIPWDDDLDVVITREDFKKLQEVAINEFKYPYFLQTSSSDKKYFVGYGRLRNSLTTGHILANSSPNYNHGIYVDIYVADGCIDDDKLLKKQKRRLFYITKLINLYKRDFESKSTIIKVVKYILFIICYISIFRFIKLEKIEEWYENEISKYSGVCEMLSTITHSYEIIRRAEFRKTEFNNIISMPFENIMIPVPKGYDEMLKRMYGNYMQFPPEKDRGEWHNNVIYFDPDTPYKEYFKQKR